MLHVLIPTDFSANAKHALRYAIAFIAKRKASIHLVHAFTPLFLDPRSPVEVAANKLAAAEQKAIANMRAFCLESPLPDNIEYHSSCKAGNTKDVVLEAIERRKIDLVIMGTKGAGGLKKALLGSNAAHIMEHATVPVLVVPSRYRFKSIRRLLYASAYSDSDAEHLKQLHKLIAAKSAETLVLHVAGEAYTHNSEREFMQGYQQLMIKKMKGVKLLFKVIFGTDFVKRIARFLKQEPADLFVVATRRRSFMGRLFHESKARDLVCRARLPILVFHRARERSAVI